MKLEPYLTPYTKINSKWIRDLNVGAINLLDSIGLGNGFSDKTTKASMTKEKICKVNYIMYVKLLNCKYHPKSKTTHRGEVRAKWAKGVSYMVTDGN